MPRKVLAAVGTSTLVFFLSARWYRADDPRHAELQRLDADLRTPVPDAPAANLSGLAVYGVIGTIALILGGVLIVCTALPGSAIAPATHNLIAGLLLAAIGLGLRRLAKRARV
jgi:hypothetical protein